MDNRVNSLSGPDITGDEPARQHVITSPLQINTSLSGPDVHPVVGRTVSNGPVISSPNRHGVSLGRSPRNLGDDTLDTNFHLGGLGGDPAYYFNGSISEEILFLATVPK